MSRLVIGSVTFRMCNGRSELDVYMAMLSIFCFIFFIFISLSARAKIRVKITYFGCFTAVGEIGVCAVANRYFE